MKPKLNSQPFLAGLISTCVMSVWNGVALGLPKLDFPFLLGSAVTSHPKRARQLGWLLQLANGGFLACGYQLLWKAMSVKPSGTQGASLGLLHGVVAAASLPPMTKLHPRPPRIQMDTATVASVVVSHVVFGTCVGATLRFLRRD